MGQKRERGKERKMVKASEWKGKWRKGGEATEVVKKKESKEESEQDRARQLVFLKASLLHVRLPFK